ncbi:MAG TPA: hypothetical protein VFL45_07035 [Gammaproteobacteria bacterium]|nr:hypothetical protein [Gammaproteobacteria bacterium]
MDVFGVKLVGVNAESGTKLLMSIAFVALVIVRWLLARTDALHDGEASRRTARLRWCCSAPALRLHCNSRFPRWPVTSSTCAAGHFTSAAGGIGSPLPPTMSSASPR